MIDTASVLVLSSATTVSRCIVKEVPSSVDSRDVGTCYSTASSIMSGVGVVSRSCLYMALFTGGSGESRVEVRASPKYSRQHEGRGWREMRCTDGRDGDGCEADNARPGCLICICIL